MPWAGEGGEDAVGGEEGERVVSVAVAEVAGESCVREGMGVAG